MLIELHEPRKGPRIDPGRFPNSLVVTVLNGGIKLKSGRNEILRHSTRLENPESMAHIQGQHVDAYRLSPNRQRGLNDEPTFRDPGEVGWEYTVECQEPKLTTSFYFLTLVREHEDDETTGWVVWYQVGNMTVDHMTLVLPGFDRMDQTPVLINPNFQMPTDAPQSAWERISGDDP